MNKNQIGLNNKAKRYGLYLIENDEAKCLSRSENYKTLITEMRRLANENYQFNFRSDDNRLTRLETIVGVLSMSLIIVIFVKNIKTKHSISFW